MSDVRRRCGRSREASRVVTTTRPLVSLLRLRVALLVSVVAFAVGVGVAEAQKGVAAINSESPAAVGADSRGAAGFGDGVKDSVSGLVGVVTHRVQAGPAVLGRG